MGKSTINGHFPLLILLSWFFVHCRWSVRKIITKIGLISDLGSYEIPSKCLVADFEMGQDLILSKLIFWEWVKNVAGRSGHWFSPRVDSCGDSALILGLRTGRTCHQQKCKFCQQKDDRWRV